MVLGKELGFETDLSDSNVPLTLLSKRTTRSKWFRYSEKYVFKILVGIKRYEAQGGGWWCELTQRPYFEELLPEARGDCLVFSLESGWTMSMVLHPLIFFKIQKFYFCMWKHNCGFLFCWAAVKAIFPRSLLLLPLFWAWVFSELHLHAEVQNKLTFSHWNFWKFH